MEIINLLFATYFFWEMKKSGFSYVLLILFLANFSLVATRIFVEIVK